MLLSQFRQLSRSCCIGALALSAYGCGGTGSLDRESRAGNMAGSGTPAATDAALRQVMAPHFSVGVAVEAAQLNSMGPLVAHHFNRLTTESSMKFRPLHPAPKSYVFDAADAVATFARGNQQVMTGHALVWHREMPEWLLALDTAAIQPAIDEHIRTVVTHFADVTDNWDVVNEALSDGMTDAYRAGPEGAPLFDRLGRDYIKNAFISARAAADATQKPIALYYNDYNLETAHKRAHLVEMLQWLKQENVPIDGVGLQGHYTLTWPSIAEIQATIEAIVGLGLKVKVSELDVSIYTQDNYNTETWEAERPFDANVERAQATRYRELFELFIRYAPQLSSVTFWGVSDQKTWLDNFPAPQRKNYPLLFDLNNQPKQALLELLSL